MNKKVFRKTFRWSLIIYLIIFAVVGGYFLMNRNIGGGEDIPELDQASAREQRNLIVFGTDEGGLRSDVIMVVSVHPKKNTLSLLSIPRDTKVKLNGRSQKINAAMSLGEESLAVQTVKELTGLSIHDYLTVNFKAVETVIDELGGIEFDVPANMRYKDPDQGLDINIKKGLQVLNGEDSVKVLRYRSYRMGDLDRNAVQQDFFRAAFEQKFHPKYIKKIPKLYELVEENIKSSMSTKELLSYVTAIQKMKDLAIETFELPVSIRDPYVVMDESKAEEIFSEYFR